MAGLLALAAVMPLMGVSRSGAAPPAYDHVVVVIEENKSLPEILGNVSAAPYLNSLARDGVFFTRFFAITHPSQPNYLEFFSGSNQSVTNNDLPKNLPFSTPNLGAELLAARRTFVGYCESLPQLGFTGASFSAIPGRNQYLRKHNPWVNWQDETIPTPANRLPPEVNQPFGNFPADFTKLPSVAIVIPNAQHDMHDGTVAVADTWLRNKMDSYNTWAKTHNSLLIIAWDENDDSPWNRIPMIFSGANLKRQQNANVWNLHNLLRTIEDIFGTAHAGLSGHFKTITGVFANDR